MRGYAGKQVRETPENLIGRVARQLRTHLMWDALLIFSPPILAVLYTVVLLYWVGWLPAAGALLAGAVLVAAGLLAVASRRRRSILSLPSAARLVDHRAEAQDRFVTLATIDTQTSSEVLVARLRRETAGLLGRIHPSRDFPYRLKKSFYSSAAASLIAAIAVHLVLAGMPFPGASVPTQQRLLELAEQMVQRPSLAEVGRRLQALAAKLEDPQAPVQEKQSMIQDLQNRLSKQQNEPQDSSDLLAAAGSTLKSLEQQLGGAQEEQQEGGAGINSNVSQDGQGDSPQNAGGSGSSQGDVTAQLNQEMQVGKAGQGEAPGAAPEPAKREQPEGKPDQAGASQPERTDTRESAADGQAAIQEKGGKGRSEEIPKDGAPAERYQQSGEQGKEGIKGAQYVTVQLPEEIAANSSAGGASKAGNENRNRPTLPVSNVPLPAHVPEAPAEKQRMPLEYRNLIR